MIGETLSIPSKMSKKLNVLGFLDINNSKFFTSTTYDRFDTEVVVNNAPTHTSRKFKEQIEI